MFVSMQHFVACFKLGNIIVSTCDDNTYSMYCIFKTQNINKCPNWKSLNSLKNCRSVAQRTIAK